MRKGLGYICETDQETYEKKEEEMYENRNRKCMRTGIGSVCEK